MTLKISIHAAVPTDAEPFQRIHTDAVRYTCASHYSEQHLAAWLSGRTPEGYLPGIERGEMYTAEADLGICGFGHAVPGEIKAVFVDPQAVGQGVGASLCHHGLEQARVGGCKTVKVIASLNAVGFYRGFGFTEVGSVTSVKDGLELPFMQMELVGD